MATTSGEDSAESGATKRARPSKKPREVTAQRRDDILRAALDTFGTRGYYNGSLIEIADKVGMTRAGVLHHFGSKDNLLLETLLFRDFTDVEGLEDKAPPVGLELFHHLVRTARNNEARPGIVKTYSVLSAESVTEGHPGQEWFRVRFEGLRSMIGVSLAMVCDDTNRPSDAEITNAATAIIAVMDGLQVQWLLDPERVGLAETTAFTINAILASLIAADGRERVI